MSDLLASMFAFFLAAYLLFLVADFTVGLVHLWTRCAPAIYTPSLDFDNKLLSNQLPTPAFATLDWIQPVTEEEVEPVDIIALAKSRLPRFDITALKIYKLRNESVVRITDIPFNIPATIKRYKLRGADVIKLAALEAIATT